MKQKAPYSRIKIADLGSWRKPQYWRYQQTELEKENGIVKCKYLQVEMLGVYDDEIRQLTNKCFCSVGCIIVNGKLTVGQSEQSITAGNSFFLPATK